MSERKNATFTIIGASNHTSKESKKTIITQQTLLH